MKRHLILLGAIALAILTAAPLAANASDRECAIVIGKQLGENGKGVWFSAENPGHGLWVDGGGEMATRLPTVVASGECLNVRLFLTPNDIARPRLEGVKP